jgi:nifR3 family TIM-barrel protein
MKIRNLNLPNNTMLAPMTGFNDHAFLILSRKNQASLVFTEKYNIISLKNSFKKYESELRIYPEEKPIIIQFIGRDPKILSEIINKLESYDYMGYDLNLCCPSPASKRLKIGGALLKEPEKIRLLVRAMIGATNKLVSAKIRIGFDAYSINALDTAKIIEEEGADFVSIHGRTVEADYSGTNNIDMIKYVKQNINIPLVGNGDVIDGKAAKKMKDYTKCDYIMIGRAAIGYPRIFYEINEYFKNINKSKKRRNTLPKISKENYLQIIRHYFTLLKGIYLNQGKKLIYFKKKLIQFHRPQLIFNDFKTKVLESESLEDLETILSK